MVPRRRKIVFILLLGTFLSLLALIHYTNNLHTDQLRLKFTRGLIATQLVASLKRPDVPTDAQLRALRLSTPQQPDQIQQIPKRVHFVYKDERVPSMYKMPVTSWSRYNPDWEVWFWTDDDAHRLMQNKFPNYLSLYNNYTHGLQKSDVIRYFILYQYGGVYSDMDVRSLKSIQPLLQGHTCVISMEPPLQTKIIFDYANTLTNSLMACVPGHPFMKHLFRGLEEASKRINEPAGVLLSTGPFFLNHTHNTYTQLYPHCLHPDQSTLTTPTSQSAAAVTESSQSASATPSQSPASNTSIQSNLDNNQLQNNVLEMDQSKSTTFEMSQWERRICHVTIMDYKYMCPKMDMPMIRLRKKYCANKGEKKGVYQQIACDELIRTGFATPKFPDEAYADHLWYHFGWSSSKEKRARRVIPVGSVIPKAKRYMRDFY